MIGNIVEALRFEDIVSQSGYRNVVSTNYPPLAWIHDGKSDTKVTSNEVPAYYLSQVGLSLQHEERARQILKKLYALGDWAAGEIVERHRRDQERLQSGYFDQKPRLTVPEMLVRRFIRRNAHSSIGQISMGLNMSTDSLRTIIDELIRRGILIESADREGNYNLSASESARYDDPLA